MSKIQEVVAQYSDKKTRVAASPSRDMQNTWFIEARNLSIKDLLEAAGYDKDIKDFTRPRIKSLKYADATDIGDGEWEVYFNAAISFARLEVESESNMGIGRVPMTITNGYVLLDIALIFDTVGEGYQLVVGV